MSRRIGGMLVLAATAALTACTGGGPGEQPTAGSGWRLLGDGLSGSAYRTGVATTPDQLETLWEKAGLDGEPPSLDFATEIGVWFGAVYSTDCPVRLDGVDVTGRVLHADIVLQGYPGDCSDDANPHAYVVAVERTMLLEERTVVEVDLSEPGATTEP